MSNYPGRNESERRSSLVKIEIHWPNLFNLGEGRTYVLILAEQYKGGGGVAAATRMERGAINWGNPPCPLRKRKEQSMPYKSKGEVGIKTRGWRMSP